MIIRFLIGRSAALARALAIVSVGLVIATNAFAIDASSAYWSRVPAEPLPAAAPQVSVYRPLRLDLAAMRAAVAPARHGATAITLALPRPDGSFADFVLVDSRTMPAALEDRYPEIVSLAGSDADGDRARVDVSPLGFQAMVFAQDGVFVIRPETLDGTDRYMSFRREDLAVPGQAFQCGVKGDAIDASGRSLLSNPAPMTTTGTTEREFRAAVAANHQYVAAVGGGTVMGGLAAVVTAMNRVNQVYETELAVHMTLIANNDTIIYASAAGDPYSNDGGALGQNQTNLDSVIGSANYDIGHVFTTGSGGVAGLRVTCVNGQKARGTTGLGNPTGDAFYIDYVSHELGHQFGGNHTFNSTTSNCGFGNRAGSAAYEPGSGSTIMAYAGICGADDLQPHSDPYFHAKSLDEINTWIGSSGGACAAATPNPDAVPVVDNAGLPDGYTIPVHTPFALTGSATDADGDALTYNWEQYDLGPATTLAQGDIGSGPIFRSFNATASGTRVFPKMSTVLGGALVDGEAWPVTNRNLTFRLTVRDNHDVPGVPQFGTTQTASDITLHVTTAAGPFMVTRPNTALTWGRGESHLVTWDVAGTDVAPVACAHVAIDLSTDGGATFAYPLAASVANSGSTTITVPAAPNSSQARVRVACVENVFFDVSDVNFNIAAVGDPDPTGAIASVSPPGFSFTLDAGTSASDTLTVANGGSAGTTLNYTVAESLDACATTTDVPWLGAAPAGGAVGGGASAPVAVAVDAGALAVGAHSASLCVATDDAAHPLFVVPVDVTVETPADDEIFKDGFDTGGAGSCDPVQLFADPSFEATDAGSFDNPFWSGSDSIAGTPYCDDSCDAGGMILARTGTWFVWFGGWDTPNTSSLSQDVVFPSGQARWLNYWMNNQIDGDTTASLVLSIDGAPLYTAPDSGGTGDYALESFAIPSTYLDGASHAVRFDWSADAPGGDIGGAIIDDVTLDCEAGRPSTTAAHPAVGIARRHR